MDELTGKQRMALRNLLGAIVLADGRIHKAEVEEYSRKLCALTGDLTLADQEAHWLVSRKEDLQDRLSSQNSRHWLAEQIAILKSAPSIADLLDAVWSVAVSDSDLHPSETEILDFAFKQWIAET
jgi:uncharacterized tellurite resistance protein B-like protein